MELSKQALTLWQFVRSVWEAASAGGVDLFDCPSAILNEAWATRLRIELGDATSEDVLQALHSCTDSCAWDLNYLTRRVVPSLTASDMTYFVCRDIRKRFHLSYGTDSLGLVRRLSATFTDTKIQTTDLDRTHLESLTERMKDPSTAGLLMDLCAGLALVRPIVGPNRPVKVRFDERLKDPDFLYTRLFGLPTNIRGFDDIFGGALLLLDDVSGTPVTRSVLISGPFGSGKSLLSWQLALEVARKGGMAWVVAPEQSARDCLFALRAIGTTPPPHVLILEGLEDWFSAVNSQVPGVCIFFRPEVTGYREFLEVLKNEIRALKNHSLKLLVVDPINAFFPDFPKAEEVPEDFISDENYAGPRSVRGQTVDLLNEARRAGVNVLFSYEESRHAPPISPYPENVADTVIRLHTDDEGGSGARHLEVTKSRAQAELPGRHTFMIESQSGITIYPSVLGFGRFLPGTPEESDFKIEFGVRELERVLGDGGIAKNEVIVLAGAGRSKVLFGMEFLCPHPDVRFEDDGGLSLFISDFTDQRANEMFAEVFGRQKRIRWDQDRVRFHCLAPGLSTPSKILCDIRERLENARGEGNSIDRVFICSIARWEEANAEIASDAMFGIMLLKLLRHYRSASLILTADDFTYGVTSLRDVLMEGADTILLMNTWEIANSPRTIVEARKTRHMQHPRGRFLVSRDLEGYIIKAAPPYKQRANGELERIPVQLFLRGETEQHRRYNTRIIEKMRAVFWPSVQDCSAHEMEQESLKLISVGGLDRIPILQLDEYQVVSSTRDVRATLLTAMSQMEDVLSGSISNLKDNVTKDGICFAVPYYANIGVLVRQDGCDLREPLTWKAIASAASQWDGEIPYFACSLYPGFTETYNCLFFEILLESTGRDTVPDKSSECDLITWFRDGLDAALTFRRLCRPFHVACQNRKGLNSLEAQISRHWFNTVQAEFDSLKTPNRARFHVTVLPGISTAGDWYLAMPAGTPFPEFGKEIITYLVSRSEQNKRLIQHVGLPTISAFYKDDFQLSPFVTLKANEVESQICRAFRRSQFPCYSTVNGTISAHLNQMLEFEGGNEMERLDTILHALLDEIRFNVEDETCAKCKRLR